MDSVIDLERVSRHYRHEEQVIVALDHVSLEVGYGSFVAVMGTTGSGKSTLLHCAAGLEHPTAGTVRLIGMDLGRLSEELGPGCGATGWGSCSSRTTCSRS